MRHILAVICLMPVIFFLPVEVHSQDGADEVEGMLAGSLGWTLIDGTGYFEMNVNPEISFGKIGVGLNLLLRFDQDGNVRKADWNSTNDYLRIINYVRYGHRGDPLYLRFGGLSSSTLGNGFIIYRYSNQVDYDERMTGFEGGLWRKSWGVEWIDSNLGMIDILGVRWFCLPLNGVVDIPIIKNLTLGVSAANDFRPQTSDNLTIWGYDVTLPILTTSIAGVDLYGDRATIATHGSGTAVGISSTVDLVANILSVGARLERRWLGDNFIPSYIDRFYEIARETKEATLDTVESTTGIFGELSGTVIGVVNLLGNYEQYDGRLGSSHLEATTERLSGFSLRGYYDKTELEDLGELFSWDDRVIMGLELGYAVKGPLYVVVTRERSFVESNGVYEPTDRTFFRLEIRYNL